MYSDVESGIINGGYVTNYFKVSRGVRQGCPLSPSLFILSAELLAQKIRQSSKSKGIKLPGNVEVKLSQFADDTTLICKDIESLKENIMIIINKFSKISGLKLNKKKTKAIWIALKTTSLYGTTKISQSKENLCIGKNGESVRHN